MDAEVEYLSQLPKWDKRFMDLAKVIASWSHDPSTKVGCVIIEDTTRQIAAVGYNGFPRAIADTNDRLNDRPQKYKLTVHAEMNALLNLRDRLPLAAWHTLYATQPPCIDCVKHIIQAGIKTIVSLPMEKALEGTWRDTVAHAHELTLEAGIIWRELK